MDRRRWLSQVTGAVAAGAACRAAEGQADERKASRPPAAALRGRIKQSVCHWCFRPMALDRLADNAAAMGIRSVELVPPDAWPALKQRGLVCAMTPSHGFKVGLAHQEEHPQCLDVLRRRIDTTAEAGFPNVITFSGMRRGLPDDVGIDNCVLGLKKIVGHAEKRRVTICLEMLNSRVATHPMKGHPDYMCDSIEWAVAVCDRVGSDRLKILFDIYHVQVMQGDIITRIRKYHDYIAHYHTAGCPGRGEMDQSQEINYRPVMEAIVETGFQGYVGQEFIPNGDPMAGLQQAVRVCDV
ncbi:MAG: hydroxypyruvate isomerase family protein [Pirellulales bacterium]